MTDKKLTESEIELLVFIKKAITNKKKKRTDDYEHIGACIEAKVKLIFIKIRESHDR